MHLDLPGTHLRIMNEWLNFSKSVSAYENSVSRSNGFSQRLSKKAYPFFVLRLQTFLKFFFCCPRYSVGTVLFLLRVFSPVKTITHEPLHLMKFCMNVCIDNL